jgi:SulP family sulfate permease
MNTPSNSKRFLGVDWPFLLNEWIDMFKAASVPADIWAGITVALVALPLNLALAIAAGVEPGVGITTAVVASIITAFLGGQRYAVSGPAAAMAVVLLPIAKTHGIDAIWLVCIMAGGLQVLAGILRFGKLISYVPMPVIVGFTNAIGILVVCNALSNFLGLPSKSVVHAGTPAPLAGHPLVPQFIEDVIGIVWHAVVHQEWSIYAVITGTIVIALALIVPRWTKAIPAQLVAIVAASAIAVLFKFDIPRIVDISAIPGSLPLPHFPNLPWEDLNSLFPIAITVFLLGSIESLLSASVADGMTMSQKHHSDQELVGQGMANLIVPLFGGIPVTGVIARTAVNIRAGAKTRLAPIIHAFTLMALSFCFAKQAAQIPLAALAGVLISTGARLFEWEASKQIWRASRTEGLVLLVTTIVSVLGDLTAGVMLGLILTCGIFVRRIAQIRIVPQEYDPDQRSEIRQPAPSCKFVRTFLVDGPLFFGAAERFAETILLTQNLKCVILHMRSVNYMDLTGAETLLSINAQLLRNDIRLVLAELPRQPVDLLRRTGALAEIGEENIFDSFREAILAVNERLLQTTCRDCAVALTPPAGGGRLPGPKECKLRSAIVLNSGGMANLMRERLKAESGMKPKVAPKLQDLDYTRLIAVNSEVDIPRQFDRTPIKNLLKAQNFYEVSDESEEAANLIVGMCIDYRKQLHLPRNCAYIIREPGANMKDNEFSIALALSSGIRYMALIVHNKCLMSNVQEKADVFQEVLVRDHQWDPEQARSIFDDRVSDRSIGDPIDFALEESKRLMGLFGKLTVVPLLYDVDTDRIFLIKSAEMTNLAMAATANGAIS